MTSHFKASADICMQGRVFLFFVVIVGRRWQVQSNAWLFFGDDIKLGGREMEAGDWKIMANGGI